MVLFFELSTVRWATRNSDALSGALSPLTWN